MPVSEQFKAPFQTQGYYHITFRSIDNVLLFNDPANYDFFLQKFTSYLQPVFSCFAYCLLKNHAHFVVQVNDRNTMLEYVSALPEEKKTMAMRKFMNDPENEGLVDGVIERQANSFMLSYVNALNKSLDRKGSLFQSPFRRVQITGEPHLQQAIIYTHANAQRHGIVVDFKEYKHTSYHEILAGYSLIIAIPQVLQFFNGRAHFIKEHGAQVKHFYECNN